MSMPLANGQYDHEHSNEHFIFGLETYKEWLEQIPAADVRPVVKARWKPRDLTHGRQYYYCTSCEETVDMPTAMGIPLFNYCPNCGADMRSTDR